MSVSCVSKKFYTSRKCFIPIDVGIQQFDHSVDEFALVLIQVQTNADSPIRPSSSATSTRSMCSYVRRSQNAIIAEVGSIIQANLSSGFLRSQLRVSGIFRSLAGFVKTRMSQQTISPPSMINCHLQQLRANLLLTLIAHPLFEQRSHYRV